MTYDSKIRSLEERVDELDREYYRSKLEELSWCLPVVRAAKALRGAWTETDKAQAFAALCKALDALAEVKVKP
jgi:hypothetical protein